MFPSPEVASDALEFHVHARNARALEAELQELVRGYIWQKEPLTLMSPITKEMDEHWCMGKMFVGDNIEDEWVATAALLELTKRHQDIAIQVADADGQFLLIEAAEALPAWVHPENMNNRVFLRDGKLYLINQDVGQGHLELSVALDALKKAPDMHRAPFQVEKIVLERLGNARTYSMQTNRHTVRCCLPEAAAIALQQLPAALAYAVEAFYYRVPSEATRICRTMKRFPPTNMVTMMVPFSRCMYAQLKQQVFAPPKPFGSIDNDDQERMLGMKIACGLELLYASTTKDYNGKLWSTQLDHVAIQKFESKPLYQDDDDAWLYVAPESLEETLRKAETRLQKDDHDNESAGELQNMASMFHSFVKKASEYDGVDMTQRSPLDNPISFNMDALMDILKPKPAKDDEDAYFFSSDEESDDQEQTMDSMMEELMDEMDMELKDTKMSKSFQTTSTEGTDGLPPVNLDFNLVSNLLESLSSQEGTAGPVSNMLQDMGFQASTS